MTKNLNKYFLFLIICQLGAFTALSQTVTNEGTDFWIAFPPNASPPAITIFISSTFSTEGSVWSLVPGVNQDFTVVPGVITQISLPSPVILQGGTEDKGIRVTSKDPISVYGLNYLFGTTGGFLALPINALGTDYRVVTYTANFYPNCSHFSVVATADNTVLTIYNRWTNSTSNVTLNYGQTFMDVETPATNEDITGSRIQSNHPVAVFGSTDCVTIPDPTCGACDQVVEQMFPYYSWGKNYITVPLAGRDASGDIFRIVSSDDRNEILINGSLAATINAGDYYETNLAISSSIITSKAALVAQFAKGQNCSGNIIGDPLMMLIPPREQFLKTYTICTLEGFASHWVNIVAPDYAVNSIYQDGILIPGAAFTQVGTTSYYEAQLPVSTGSHTYNSLHPFGIFVYGWNSQNSYGYPGGCSLSPVGAVNSVTISPPTVTGLLNVSTLCFTAHVEDNLSNPVAGVLVNFDISGISNITGTAYTDALGNAQYCYARTGTTPGTDNIYAECFGFISTTSTAIWTYTPPCSNPTSSGTIGNSQSGCGSFFPAPLVSITLPLVYSGTLEYKWQQSITSSISGFSDITGSNFPDYSPGPLTQTTWYRRLARVDCMNNWIGAAITEALEMTVTMPVTPAVAITADLPEICTGETVTFTANPFNGGTGPSYQWKVNGINSGINSPVLIYSPANGDVITCSLLSSESCTSGNPAQSNQITMVVNANLPAGIAIAASANPFCPGSAVTFTANPVNGGSSPGYQWKVNGINSGSNASTFVYNPVNNDSIRCILTSNHNCVTGSPVSSAKIIMSGTLAPNVTFTSCFDTITTVSAKPFKLKGGIPLGGTYSGPGVNSMTSIFTPSLAGTGLKTIQYTYTNVASCSAGKSKTILVQANPVFTCGNSFTDIRDGKSYPTVQIGTQCWMASNLNYGSNLNSSQFQNDNCLSEKYCYNDLSGNCTKYGGLYQWNEMMTYDDTPAGQGLCPPGWHVPTESEWTTLINYYQGNGLAGKPLQDSVFNGFRAMRSGVYYVNSSMSFMGFATLFWSSTPGIQFKSISHGVNTYNYSVSLYEASRANSFSIRCLKD